MTLTLDLQGQFLKKLYLRNGRDNQPIPENQFDLLTEIWLQISLLTNIRNWITDFGNIFFIFQYG